MVKSKVKKGLDLNDKKDMGMGELGKPSLIFARKFRWTLEGQNLPQHFFKAVKIDYKNKKIDFEYYDVKDGKIGFHAHDWAEQLSKLPEETLLLKTYDGCGNCLYAIEFLNLKLLEHKNDFDYAVSDPSESKISVSYRNTRREVK